VKHDKYQRRESRDDVDVVPQVADARPEGGLHRQHHTRNETDQHRGAGEVPEHDNVADRALPVFRKVAQQVPAAGNEEDDADDCVQQYGHLSRDAKRQKQDHQPAERLEGQITCRGDCEWRQPVP
jgi:hypothetical protein